MKQPAITLKNCTIHIHIPAAAFDGEQSALRASLANIDDTRATLDGIQARIAAVSQETSCAGGIDLYTAAQRCTDTIADAERKRAAIRATIDAIQRHTQALVRPQPTTYTQRDLDDHPIVQDAPDPDVPEQPCRHTARSESESETTHTVQPAPSEVAEVAPPPEILETEPAPAAARTCPYPGCDKPITAQAVGCPKHWRKIKKAHEQALHLVQVAHRKNGTPQPQPAG